MSQTLTYEQTQQVHHIACMAVLAMCARGVAGTEFASTPEVDTVRISVTRSDGSEHSVDVEFINANGIPLGGMSI
jgi:hypothetical protein